MSRRLRRGDLEGSAVEVAPRLLGVVVAARDGDAVVRVRIVETEAYEPDDLASHSVRGPTRRNRSMFERAGTLYVYRAYGLHRCANVVTGPPGTGSAVLLRAAEPLAGSIERLRDRRPGIADRDLCRGPGRLTAALGIVDDDDGTDLVRGHRVWLEPGEPPTTVVASPRVGISVATDLAWRFSVGGSPWVSPPRPSTGRPGPPP